MTGVVVEPMSRELILWRCLHGGPLSRSTIETWEPDGRMPWAQLRARNVPLLERLTEVYGACAMVARDGERIVGQLRFYPKAVGDMPDAGMLCLQQLHPSGPVDGFSGAAFPAPEAIADRTLVVNCLMTGSPQQKENPYQRRGVGTRLVRALIEWAGQRGWRAIESMSFEDMPTLYAMTGSAGRTFWEKLGFRVVGSEPEPAFAQESDLVRALRAEATGLGLPPDSFRTRLTLRLDLAPAGSA